MSLVFLHVGQCGNQLAQSFWEGMDHWSRVPTKASHKSISAKATVCKPVASSVHSCDRALLPYSLPDGSLPCILVDSESKVVQRCARQLGNKVPKDNIFTDKAGRGNNWAYGYNGRYLNGSGSSNLAEQVMECVRKVVERCDRFMGAMLFQSLAGGTGSGLGSSLVEHLRDDYPLAYLLSILVAPFKHGETPLQHYNSLLSLSWTHQYCDAALLFQNDSVLEQLHKQGGKQGRGDSVRTGQESVEDMNAHISKCLCNVFRPLWSPKSSKACFEPLEMVKSICPDPSTKFITPVHSDSLRATTTWDQLISSLTRPAQATTHTSSVIFIARGNRNNIDLLARNSQSLEHKLKVVYNTVKWNPFPVDFWLSQESVLQERKSVTVLANTSSAGDYISGVCERARVMFEEKAYLHWYQKYGCEQDTFREAFQNIETIIESYCSL